MCLLEAKLDPRALFSLSLSSVLANAEENFTFVEMLSYMMYQALIRSYHVSKDGKYCVDSLQLDLLVVALRSVTGNNL